MLIAQVYNNKDNIYSNKLRNSVSTIIVYYDARGLAPYVDFINLLAFDFYTPERNPKEADYPAPLYELIDRKQDENIDVQVSYW